MPAQTTITVRIFGTLDSTGKESGLASVAEVSIPSGGCAARVLAAQLELPLDELAAVHVNHQVYSLEHCIEPGDCVAFVPVVTPSQARGQMAGLGANGSE